MNGRAACGEEGKMNDRADLPGGRQNERRSGPAGRKEKRATEQI